MADARRLDTEALQLLSADVLTLSDDELSLPTPCAGWQVTNLLRHMAGEHERILTGILFARRRRPTMPGGPSSAVLTPIATEITMPGSPLVGAGRAYAPRLAGNYSAFDQVIALTPGSGLAS